MTEEQLAEIEAREKAATPGPWRWDGCEVLQLTDGGKGYPLDYYPDSKDIVTCSGVRSDADGHFIAAARTAVPALIAEVRRLREADVAYEMESKLADKVIGDRNALRAEVERLRGELAKERSHLLADEERRKLTGDALHAEAQLTAERDAIRALVQEWDLCAARLKVDLDEAREQQLAERAIAQGWEERHNKASERLAAVTAERDRLCAEVQVHRDTTPAAVSAEVRALHEDMAKMRAARDRTAERLQSDLEYQRGIADRAEGMMHEANRVAADLRVESALQLEAERAERAAVTAERDAAWDVINAAWQATGVAGQVRGITTLADVVAANRRDLEDIASARKVLVDRQVVVMAAMFVSQAAPAALVQGRYPNLWQAVMAWYRPHMANGEAGRRALLLQQEGEAIQLLAALGEYLVPLPAPEPAPSS